MRAVTFDLDGTPAEVRWRRVGLWRHLLRWPRVLGAYAPAVQALRGRRFPDGARALEDEVVTRSGEERAVVRRALEEAIDQAWPRLFGGAAPPDAVRALIAACDEAGVPRAVVSDHAALSKLEAMGLGGWSAVIDCSALGAYKPLPDGLWTAAAQLGVPVSALTHIGDRWDTDGRAAAAAGCAFIHVDQLAPDRLWPLAVRGAGADRARNPS